MNENMIDHDDESDNLHPVLREAMLRENEVYTTETTTPKNRTTDKCSRLSARIRPVLLPHVVNSLPLFVSLPFVQPSHASVSTGY